MARSKIPPQVWAEAERLYQEKGRIAAHAVIAPYGLSMAATDKHMERYQLTPGIEYAEPGEISDDALAQEVANERRIEGLNREVKIWKRKYEEAIKRGSLDDVIADMMRDYRQAMPIPKLKLPTRVPKTIRTKESLVLLLTDLHVGETVDAEQMHGVNKYDIDVFLARMEALLEKIEDICFEHLTGYEFEEIVVNMLGDLINGMMAVMHDELIVTQAADLMETVYGLAYVLVQFIARLRTRFARVKVNVCPGNHGRMVRKPMAKSAHLNWDVVIPQIVSTYFADDPAVVFNIPNSFFFIDEVRGQRFIGFHGHQIKGHAGIPWYGINRFVGNLTEIFADRDLKIDHAVMGHFHQEMVQDRINGEFIAGPCMKGSDEYSLSAGFRPNPAGQTMFGVHEDHGITHRWRINLQHAYEPQGLLSWYPGGALGEIWKKVAA